MQVVVALYTIGSFRWETLMLATASFPIYGRALVNAVLGKDQKWHVTGSTTKKNSPFNFITHQLMAFVFLAITSVVGIWQALTVSSFTLALFWNLLNTVIRGLFVATAVRESRNNREARGKPPVGAKRAAKKAATHPADPAAAREQLASLPAEIDNGTTKSYVMAFVFSRPGPATS